MKLNIFLIFFLLVFSVALLYAEVCIECHEKITPNIVEDWKISLHSENEISCSTCHGEDHT